MIGQERVLVIHDGSLAAMVACLTAPALGEVVAWLPPPGSFLRRRGVSEALQDALAVQQAEILGLGRLVRAGSVESVRMSDAVDTAASEISPRGSQANVWGGMLRSVELLLAIASAREYACRRVVWPVVCGNSIEAMFDATERATHVTRLSWLDPAPDSTEVDETASNLSHSIRIETPFADLTPEQVAEMAADLDAPSQAAWWLEAASPAVKA